MLRVLALLALLTVSAAQAATTIKTTVTNASWTDLGAGPMLLSFRGSGVYAISDTTPSLVAEGFALAAGDSVSLSTTSHVWAMASGSPSVDAYVAPITAAGGGGGGSSSITAGSTPTSGFTAGQLLMSDGALAQASNVTDNGTSVIMRPNGNSGYGLASFSGNSGLVMSIGMFVGFSPGYANVNNPDTVLVRTATTILSERNGTFPTSPAAFRVYNSYTDANNGEWAALDWQTTPNVLTIGTQHNGTGTARPINLVAPSLEMNGVVGVTCAAPPTAAFHVTNGIVTAC